MSSLVVYYNIEQTFVMAAEDEPEFIARYFDGDEPNQDEWDRMEIDGPVQLDHPPSSPDITQTFSD